MEGGCQCPGGPDVGQYCENDVGGGKSAAPGTHTISWLPVSVAVVVSALILYTDIRVV